MQVVTIQRQVSRHGGGRSVLHELGVERATDGDGGEAMSVNQLGQSQGGFGQPMRAKAGNDINHRRRSRLQPKGEF